MLGMVWAVTSRQHDVWQKSGWKIHILVLVLSEDSCSDNLDWWHMEHQQGSFPPSLQQGKVSGHQWSHHFFQRISTLTANFQQVTCNYRSIAGQLVRLWRSSSKRNQWMTSSIQWISEFVVTTPSTSTAKCYSKPWPATWEKKYVSLLPFSWNEWKLGIVGDSLIKSVRPPWQARQPNTYFCVCFINTKCILKHREHMFEWEKIAKFKPLISFLIYYPPTTLLNGRLFGKTR